MWRACPGRSATPRFAARSALNRAARKIGLPLGVEGEHLRRVRRQEVPVLARPVADLDRAALQHGDVERVDLLLHEDLGAGGAVGAKDAAGTPRAGGWSR